MAGARSKPKNPDEAALRAIGLGFPEVTEEFPWGHRALKVRGKAFVFMGTGAEGGADHDDFFISCKLPESAPVALTLPEVKPTGYGLGKSGWVSAQYPPGEAPLAMLGDWLRESYRAIAPKTLAARLDEAAPAPKTKVKVKVKVKAKTASRAKAKVKARPAPRAKAEAKARAR